MSNFNSMVVQPTNAIISGRIGSGKTTLIKHILKITKVKWGGFFTERIFSLQETVAHQMVTNDGRSGIFAHKEWHHLPRFCDMGYDNTVFEDLGVDILAKVIFSFSPDVIMSPLALPRRILDPWVDEHLNAGVAGSLKDILLQLKTRPTFQEQYGEEVYQKGIAKGKGYMLELESMRTQSTTMDEIFSKRVDVYEWWKSIS